MSPDILTLVAGAAISLACSYVPGLSPRFELLDPTCKRLAMLILLAVAAVAIYVAACDAHVAPYFAGIHIAAECGEAGIGLLLQTFALAAIANRTTYQLTKRPHETTP